MWPFWPLILNAGMHLSRWGVVLNLRKNLYHFPYIMRSSEVNDTLEGYQWFIFKKNLSLFDELFLLCVFISYLYARDYVMLCICDLCFAFPLHLYSSSFSIKEWVCQLYLFFVVCFAWTVILVVNLLLHSPCLNHAFSFT